MKKERKQLMIGMHDSGKTTLLAALFHVVESSQIENSLQLVDLGENRDYLVAIRDKWLGCVKMERTKLGKEKIIQLKLADPATDEVTELVLPDLSGESFRDQWEKRVSTEIYDDLASQTEGVLFFLHPNTIKEPVRINQIKLIADVLDDESDQEKVKVEVEAVPPETQDQIATSENAVQINWDLKFAPTQVQLIEILQFLLREPDVYPLSQIAVIISAWDLLKEDYKTPSKWLSERVPMLNQFLRANSDIVGFKVFGISAQGGELSKNVKDNAALLLKQSERIEVVTDVENEYDKHDITAPVKWLMKNCN